MTSPNPEPQPEQTDQPTPAPTVEAPASTPRVPLLRFQTPAPTTPPPSTAPATESGAAAGPASTGPSEPTPEPPSTPSGSSRGSSPATDAGKVTAPKALQETIATAVEAVTTIAHQMLTRDEIEKDLGLWLADAQDTAGVSVPGAKLLARRGLLEGATSDVGDILALGIAAAGYAVKQFHKLRAIRQARRGQFPAVPAGDVPQP